jgi:hypothetical protein
VTVFYNVVNGLMDAARSAAGLPGYTSDEWPPSHVKKQWEAIEGFRRRYVNDAEELLPYATHFSGASESKKSTYTPVPLARDISRISSQLLFSEDPQFRYEANQAALDELVSANELEAHLQDSGEKLAYEGVGALRVIRDDAALKDIPIISYVSGDQVLWEIRHGRFVAAGTVIAERRESETAAEVFRLFERHEPGRITRKLYRGTNFSRGKEVPLATLKEFAKLPEAQPTRPGLMTLVRWPNVPNGASDLAGLDRLLDRVDEGASYGVSKMRKSDPWVVADSSVANENGTVDLSGVVFVRRDGGMPNMAPEMGAKLPSLAEVVQPGLAADEHIAMVESFVNMTLEVGAGYSRATWGRDQGGSADSGKALKIRQTRTLMTRAGKDRMTKGALAKALAAALIWQKGGDQVKVAREIEVTLGDGLPDDPLETAQEIQALVSAEAITYEQIAQKLHPNAPKKDIDRIAGELKEQYAPPQASVPRVPGLTLNLGGDGESGRK